MAKLNPRLTSVYWDDFKDFFCKCFLEKLSSLLSDGTTGVDETSMCFQDASGFAGLRITSISGDGVRTVSYEDASGAVLGPDIPDGWVPCDSIIDNKPRLSPTCR